MPTIDDLPAAVSVSDSDEIMLSQNDISRKATRAQLLGGVQPALALSGGTILGRLSAGVGGPEAIAIGANLTTTYGTISGAAPFVISSLGQSGSIQPGDLVPIAQGGQNAAVSYAAFMGGLRGVAGIDASSLLVTPRGAPGARLLSEIESDSITVESFGAVGDGITDDTAAFTAAIASGATIRLDSRTYIVNGGLQLLSTPAMIGVAGATVLRRNSAVSGGAWIEIGSPQHFMTGITFDGNNQTIVDLPNVSILASCMSCIIDRCTFMNAGGASQGHGLKIDFGPDCMHTVAASQFIGNSQCGLTGYGVGQVDVTGCRFYGNGWCGILFGNSITANVVANQCELNSIGISIGDSVITSAGNNEVPITISGNYCCNIAQYGIAVAGTSSLINGNTIVVDGNTHVTGLTLRLTNSVVCKNIILGAYNGIDARVCCNTTVSGNSILGCTTGILSGGMKSCSISDNFISGPGWGLIATAIEPTLSVTPGDSVVIKQNVFAYSSSQGGGIQVLDAATGVSVVDNSFNGSGGASDTQALWLHAPVLIVRGNSLNGQPEALVQPGIIAGINTLVVPDVVDRVLITACQAPILSMLTSHQSETLGQILFIQVTAGGSGYSQAEVIITGTGTGAAANAVVSNGQVIWVVVTNPGSGYGSIGTPVAVVITGDGGGATAVATAGLPVLEGRQIRVSTNTNALFRIAGSSPPFSSWTGFDTTVPACGAAEFEGTFGEWRLVQSPPSDYLAPTGTGGVTIQSVSSGDITLRPAAGGSLNISNASEPVGCTSTVGRGGPNGNVSAPPGSDYRNLDGGVGNTFWIKQSGENSFGWLAIA